MELIGNGSLRIARGEDVSAQIFIEPFQTRSKVHVFTDGGVIKALGAAKVAHIGHTGVNAYACAENNSLGSNEFSHALLQKQSATKYALVVIGLAEWRIPTGEERIANELHQESVGLVDTGNRLFKIVVHQLRQFTRIHAFRQFREISNVREHNAQHLLFSAGLEQLTLLKKLFSANRRKM